MTDLERAIILASDIVSDPKRHANSKTVILAREFLKLADRMARMLEERDAA